MTRHWTEDDCIDRLYGIGPGDEHLGECAECRALWQRFELRRAAVRADIENEGARVHVPPYPTIDARRRATTLRWVPALAGAGALAAGLLLIYPMRTSVSPVPSNSALVSASDAQFFDEVAALDQSPEPRAARTAEALFEDREN